MAVQTQIQTRRGSAATWTSTNPTLAAGEIGFESDTNKFKIGTGSTAWVSLPYASNVSPLTTKGDLYTYSTDNARLAVGSNGETLVADSSTSTGLGWISNFAAGKNKIINGDFNINQRRFTSSTTSAEYNFDRWRTVYTGGTSTTTSQTFALGTAPVAGYEGKNFYRVAITGQSAVTDSVRVQEEMESVRTFAGQTIAVSFWAKAATGTPKIAVNMAQNFGTGGSPSTGVNISTGTVTISTSWARYSLSVAVPSIAGKTIGTNNDDAFSLRLMLSGGSSVATAQGIGLQNATFDIWGVQVEAGSVATAFATASGGSFQGELAMCQRYYQKSYAQATAPATASTTAGCVNYQLISASPADNRNSVRFPVVMRTTPTITLFSTNSGTSAKVYVESTAADVDGVAYYIGDASFNYYLNSGTTGLGYVSLVQYTASAEL
jgi:hypothetical protein